ncbi:hypothetical protein DRW41_16110 [Neobacillus piezotolerans]|uniref:Uncharacterized protein n=1 Tax=Neobacillus piezotolerans TaxID=2259171 RepID=A0A3D8GN60_9BACI|nr:hypothetical protein [Neobacillus piezotolerans]RDU35669.1 hypothetical protein DRW41_16110 [Neobacillus piezotolerans]
MDQPNYVLSTNENILVPKNKKISRLKLPVLIIIAVMLIGSILFQDNLFSELSATTQILLISLVIGIFSAGGSTRAPSPIELRFYDDYLVVYRPKRYYDERVTRREFNKFYYKDISKIVFKSNLQRLHIYGIINVEWYNYDKNGELPSKPTKVMSTRSLCFFRTSAAPEVDFVAEIENHSPIKVTVE